MSTKSQILTAQEFLAESQKSYLEKTRGAMTASKLKALLDCPWSYNEKYEKENAEFSEEGGDHFSIGNAVDYRVSYGQQAFNDKYEVLKPYAKRDLTAEKTQLTNSTGQPVLDAIEELKRQPLFRLDDPAATAQYKIRGQYETPHGPVDILGTPDRVFLDEDWVDDTKTVSIKGNGKFVNACKYNITDYSYLFSMSFYAVLYLLETGRLPKKLTLSFVGSNGSCQFLQYEIPRELWEPRVDQIKAALCFYAECKANNYWPNHQELHQQDVFRHLSCPFYRKNPGAIQAAPIPYFDDSI